MPPDNDALALPGAAPAITRRTLALVLSGQRAIAWCAVLLIIEVLTLAFFIVGTHGYLTAGPLITTTDFSSFYAAGRLANEGHPALAYDQAAHYAEEQRDTMPGIVYSYFYYPPVFLMICALLGRLPYLLSFVVFGGVTGALYVTAALRILARKHWAVLIAVLAFPANFYNFGLGQNGFLTAGLFGFATLLIDRRPVLAGMLFGGLIVKPHFGLLIPVALLAGLHGRALLGATFSVLALVGLSALWFGVDTWAAFIESFIHSPSMYQSGKIAFGGMVSVFGAMRLAGFEPNPAYAVQAIATVLSMAAVAVVWQRKLSLPVRAATLMAATVTAIPLILFYDMTMVGMAVAWLARDGGRVTVMEKLLIGSVLALALLVYAMTKATSIPLGLLATCIVLGMALHRGVIETKARARIPALP